MFKAAILALSYIISAVILVHFFLPQYEQSLETIINAGILLIVLTLISPKLLEITKALISENENTVINNTWEIIGHNISINKLIYSTYMATMVISLIVSVYYILKDKFSIIALCVAAAIPSLVVVFFYKCSRWIQEKTETKFFDARREMDKFFPKEGIILGCFRDLRVMGTPYSDFRLSRYKTDKHLLSIAPNRSGKGTGLILPNLLDNSETSVFVIDPKGENALVSAQWRKNQGHEIVIFNPYGIHAEEFAKRGFDQFQTFNPLANLDPASSRFVGDVDNLAEALIYGTGEDSHWTEAARGLVGLLIMYLVTEDTETPTLLRLRELLAGGLGRESPLKKALIVCEKSPCRQVRENVGRFQGGEDDKEISGILATAETQTRILRNKALCKCLEGSAFDFGDMKRRKISVYLVLPSDYLITQARFLRLVIMSAMTQFMRTEAGAHRVLVLLDEFANLGPLSLIEQGFGLIAGYGVTLWPFVQNLSQLQKLYEKNWEVFIANAAVVTVSDINDKTTAEYFSDRAGRRRVMKESHTKSGSYAFGFQSGRGWSVQKGEHIEEVLVSGDFFDAPQNSIFLFYERKAPPLMAEKAHYYSIGFLADRADKNPFYTGAAVVEG